MRPHRRTRRGCATACWTGPRRGASTDNLEPPAEEVDTAEAGRVVQALRHGLARDKGAAAAGAKADGEHELCYV